MCPTDERKSEVIPSLVYIDVIHFTLVSFCAGHAMFTPSF
jgi:hypothetical protein